MPSPALEVPVKRTKIFVALALTALMLAACGSDGSSAKNNAPDPGALYAPPQFKPVVDKLLAAYKVQDPKSKLVLTTQEQNEIVKSIDDGKPEVAIVPDLWLKLLSDKRDSTPFGRNLAVIAVPSGNPKKVTGLTDFAKKSSLKSEVCGANTAVGNFILLVLSKAKVTPDPATVKENCENDALQQVAAGTLDTALLFRNNTTVPPGVELIQIPTDQNVIFDISSVLIGKSADATGFTKFIASDAGQTILKENGYLP